MTSTNEVTSRQSTTGVGAAAGMVPPFGFRVRTTPDGRVTIDGDPLDTTGAPSPEAAAIGWVSDRAREAGHPLTVTATDPTGHEVHLLVHPDGHSELDPDPAVPQLRGPDRPSAPRGPVGGGAGRPGSATGPRSGRDRTDRHPDSHPGPRLRPVPASVGAAAPPPAAAGSRPLQPAGLVPRLRPADRPTGGWRARVHTWTGGRVSPPPSAAQVYNRELIATVQARIDGPALVAVVNPKGGAGKTPATLCAAATWGAHRGSVVAWDDNETRGTLGMRALADPRETTVAGLIADLDRFTSPTSRIGDLAAYLRPQGSARFDVLASDTDPARMEQFGAEQFSRVRDVLARFYAITVVDTGNNVRASNWQSAVDAAQQLLLVSTYQRDAAVTASWTLDHLHATGRGHLADTAVTVLSAATPTTDRRSRNELRDHFTARTRAVIEIPYDPVIADGEHLDLTALRPTTRDAWLQATAALTEGLIREN